MQGLDEKDHCELGMNHRLFNVDDVKPFLKEKLGYFRDDPNPIFSNHRDDIEIFFFGKRMEWHLLKPLSVP
jgi:hypothetical protein